jgi:Ni/Fe-hydrogenase subunit HybB-like protein
MIVYIFRLEKYRPALRLALLTGFLSYVSVLIILLIDLGRPDRFWGFIVYPNIHSPLFEISWCILLYTVVLTFEVGPLILERLKQPKLAELLHKIVIPVTIGGVMLSTLHQSTLGTLYLALPGRTGALWWSWLMPILYYLSAIGAGMSATILVSWIANKAFGRQVESNVLAGLAKGSVWLWVVYLVFRIGDLLFTGDLGAMFAFDSLSIRFWIELLLMAGAPIVLYSMPSVRKSDSALLVTALLTIVGLFLNRFNPLFSGSPVPVGASHAEFSYFPSLIEFAVQIGVLSAAALIWYLGARFLPVFGESKSH